MIRHPLRVLLLAVGTLALLAAAGCSSSGGGGPRPSQRPSPTDSFQAMNARLNKLSPLFVQCLARHNVPIWAKGTGKEKVAPVGARQGWYKNGRVIRNRAFVLWLDNHDGMYPLGPGFKPDKMIADWVQDAATNGTWPTKACGPLPNV